MSRTRTRTEQKQIPIATEKVRFIRHLVTSDGLNPDPEKVKFVEEMPRLEDVAGVRRLL